MTHDGHKFSAADLQIYACQSKNLSFRFTIDFGQFVNFNQEIFHFYQVRPARLFCFYGASADDITGFET